MQPSEQIGHQQVLTIGGRGTERAVRITDLPDEDIIAARALSLGPTAQIRRSPAWQTQRQAPRR